ncbi:MAG: TldD/PmbA family protein [Actinomycetota bacterium]
MSDLGDLCSAAVDASREGEQVEAYAEETRRTNVRAREGEVSALEFAESRGVGVRLIAGHRLGYSYVADPSESEVVEALERARENARFATEDEFNALPAAAPAEPLPELFRESQAEVDTEKKVGLALDLEKAAVTADPRVRKVEEVTYGDAVSRLALASTLDAGGEYSRTDCWCVVSTLAEQDDETQTGFSFRIAREMGELEWQECAAEGADRAARLLGAKKPPSGRFPIVLDPHAGSSFLGVLAGAVNADAVQKGRSLFAGLVGEEVASSAVSLVDDGRLLDGPAAAPFDDEGVPAGRTELISNGVLRGFLHNTYTALRGGEASTGNASRPGYRGPPSVSPSNFFLEEGDLSPEEILARADGGVLIQEVSGVHSGANPISGEFSVGATGLRIEGGTLGEPLREMTVASTIPDMLRSVDQLGADLRFFSSIGCPAVLISEMTIAGT